MRLRRSEALRLFPLCGITPCSIKQLGGNSRGIFAFRVPGSGTLRQKPFSHGFSRFAGSRPALLNSLAGTPVAFWRTGKAVTFIEMMVCLSILGYLVFAAVGVDIFSRHQLLNAERRSKLQNQLSYTLEHMAKNISKGIGDKGNNPVTVALAGKSITVQIDFANSGLRDATNRTIGYRFLGAPDYQIDYDDDTGAGYTLLPLLRAGQIKDCTFAQEENFVKVDIQACWFADERNKPDGSPNPCGTIDNPSLTMTTRICMPAYSLN